MSAKLILELNPEHLDPKLLTEIGYALEQGRSFKKDYHTAMMAYDIAAAHPEGALAANNLGWMFLNGLGVSKDIPKALALFQNAAQRGNSTAMVNLGNYYEFQEPADYKSAAHWYRLAAEHGNEKGIFNYANMLHHGKGVRKNRPKAFALFSQLYENRKAGAAFYMGLYHEEGYVVEQDYEKAREYYRIGVLENDAYCFCQLGVMYAKGLGVPQNFQAAFDYYKRGAELGDLLSYTNLGYCYEVGQGVKADIQKALECYRFAADRNELQAIDALKRLKEV